MLQTPWTVKSRVTLAVMIPSKPERVSAMRQGEIA